MCRFHAILSLKEHTWVLHAKLMHAPTYENQSIYCAFSLAYQMHFNGCMHAAPCGAMLDTLGCYTATSLASGPHGHLRAQHAACPAGARAGPGRAAPGPLY